MRVASKVSNLPSNLGTLWVLELFVMYATDGRTDRRTDGRTDKSNAYCPLSYGRGYNNYNNTYKAL